VVKLVEIEEWVVGSECECSSMLYCMVRRKIFLLILESYEVWWRGRKSIILFRIKGRQLCVFKRLIYRRWMSFYVLPFGVPIQLGFPTAINWSFGCTLTVRDCLEVEVLLTMSFYDVIIVHNRLTSVIKSSCSKCLSTVWFWR